jgi:hypothetical protein
MNRFCIVEGIVYLSLLWSVLVLIVPAFTLRLNLSNQGITFLESDPLI